MLVDVDRLIAAYYDERPDPSNPAQAVSFGTSGHRGTSFTGTFTESHILAISEAIVRYRTAQGIDGPLYPGARHARALRARVPDGGRGARGPRRRGRGRRPGRLHADAGGLARDPDAQRPRRRPCRRRRDHAVAQPARGRRVQVQPAARRPGRHRRDAADPGRGERVAARGRGRDRAPAVRGGDRPAHDATTTSPRTSGSCRRSSTSTRSRAPGSGSASTRWAARASRTGRRSPTATGSTSRSSTTGSTRRSRSCRSTTTGRSGWTAPRPTRWRT